MIAIASDHIGILLKKEIEAFLNEKGLVWQDFGAYDEQRTDYPIYAERAARAVSNGTCDKGILICGTGVGIGLAANKIPGIRCVTCSEPYSAILSRQHNNCNMISIGARVIGVEVAKLIIEQWLTTPFEGGRHQRRIDQIATLEDGGTLQGGIH